RAVLCARGARFERERAGVGFIAAGGGYFRVDRGLRRCRRLRCTARRLHHHERGRRGRRDLPRVGAVAAASEPGGETRERDMAGNETAGNDTPGDETAGKE